MIKWRQHALRRPGRRDWVAGGFRSAAIFATKDSPSTLIIRVLYLFIFRTCTYVEKLESVSSELLTLVVCTST